MMNIPSATRNIYKDFLANEAKILLDAYDKACQKTQAHPVIASSHNFESFEDDTHHIRMILKGLVFGAKIGGHDTFQVRVELLADMVDFQEKIDQWVARLP